MIRIKGRDWHGTFDHTAQDEREVIDWLRKRHGIWDDMLEDFYEMVPHAELERIPEIMDEYAGEFRLHIIRESDELDMYLKSIFRRDGYLYCLDYVKPVKNRDGRMERPLYSIMRTDARAQTPWDTVASFHDPVKAVRGFKNILDAKGGE